MSLNQEFQYVFKILIVGNSCAGKTNILCRFADNIFHESFLPTIGVDFRIRSLEVDNKSIKLQIWDTAGQERFKTITATYYKGAHGCILVYDITDRQSFQDIENWLGEVRQHASANIVKILVGNKCDMKDQRQVSYQEGKEFAESLGMQFLETSAKDKINIDEAFMTLTKAILPTVPAGGSGSGGRTGGADGSAIAPGPIKPKKKDGGCC